MRTAAVADAATGQFFGARTTLVIAAQYGDPVADRVQEMFERQRCLCVRGTDDQQVSWLVSVRRPAAVLVIGGSPLWRSTVIRSTRAATSAALVLVGRPHSPEIVRALVDGADAVVADDAYDDEILARVSAVVRRTSAVQDPGVRYLEAGALRVDLWAKGVAVADNRLGLSPTEYRLLVLLMRNSGRALSTAHLIGQVWGWTEAEGLNTLRIFIARVRRKLADAGTGANLIESVRRFGYRFNTPVLELGSDENTNLFDQGMLLRSVTDLAKASGGFTSYQEAAGFLTESLVTSRAADSSAVLRVDGGRLEVVAHAGLTQAWCDSVCPSIPLDPRYASVRAVEDGQVALFSRGSVDSSHLTQTVDLLTCESSDFGVFMPIMIGTTCWGTLGALSKSGRSYSAATIAYLQLVVAIFGTALSPALSAG